MGIHNLFPKPVGIYRLDRDLSDVEKEFLLGLEQKGNEGNTTSVNNYVLKDKTLLNLKEFLELSLDKYFMEVYEPSTNVRPYITQSWINYSQKGQYHHQHQHPNSLVSGIFYVKADEKKDKVYFIKSEYQQLKIPTENYNPWNSESWWFEVKTGDLFLFPSSLTHKVTTVETDLRVSLSFNTFLKGSFGKNNELTELVLEK
jgi:uncharacterized protein (TIGR02466 family)